MAIRRGPKLEELVRVTEGWGGTLTFSLKATPFKRPPAYDLARQRIEIPTLGELVPLIYTATHEKHGGTQTSIAVHDALEEGELVGSTMAYLGEKGLYIFEHESDRHLLFSGFYTNEERLTKDLQEATDGTKTYISPNGKIRAIPLTDTDWGAFTRRTFINKPPVQAAVPYSDMRRLLGRTNWGYGQQPKLEAQQPTEKGLLVPYWTAQTTDETTGIMLGFKKAEKIENPLTFLLHE